MATTGTLTGKAANAGNPFKRAIPVASDDELLAAQTAFVAAALPEGPLAEVFARQLAEVSAEIERREATNEINVVSSTLAVELVAGLIGLVEGKPGSQAWREMSVSVSERGAFTVAVITSGTLGMGGVIGRVRCRAVTFEEALSRTHEKLADSASLPSAVPAWVTETAAKVACALQVAKASGRPARFFWQSKSPDWFKPDQVEVSYSDYSKHFDKLDEQVAYSKARKLLVEEAAVWLASFSG